MIRRPTIGIFFLPSFVYFVYVTCICMRCSYITSPVQLSEKCRTSGEDSYMQIEEKCESISACCDSSDIAELSTFENQFCLAKDWNEFYIEQYCFRPDWLFLLDKSWQTKLSWRLFCYTSEFISGEESLTTPVILSGHVFLVQATRDFRFLTLFLIHIRRSFHYVLRCTLNFVKNCSFLKHQ